MASCGGGGQDNTLLPVIIQDWNEARCFRIMGGGGGQDNTLRAVCLVENELSFFSRRRLKTTTGRGCTRKRNKCTCRPETPSRQGSWGAPCLLQRRRRTCSCYRGTARICTPSTSRRCPWSAFGRATSSTRSGQPTHTSCHGLPSWRHDHPLVICAFNCMVLLLLVCQ